MRSLEHFQNADLGICKGCIVFNIQNLVFRARSELNGFAGKIASSIGVLEHWSIGVLQKRKP